MKVVVWGRHPSVQPGFCGVMSLFEARHLAEFGHDVTVVLPFKSRAEMSQSLKFRGYGSVEELPKFGGEFEWQAVFLDEQVKLPQSDLLIWQSIDAQEWQGEVRNATGSTRVLSKNFPKIVASAPAPLSQHSMNQFGAFDLVTFALKEDLTALQCHREFWSDISHRAAYVPRGADPTLLSPAKPNFPVVALDMPNVKDLVGIEHYLEPLRQLKIDYPDLQVTSLGGNTGLDFATPFSYRPFDAMYRDFLNPAWLYCIIDYAQSAPHIQGAIHNCDRDWDARAIYEVQTVEAQMAGAVITGYQRNIIPELINPDTSALIADFADPDDIYGVMRSAIENFEAKSAATRRRAEHLFSWKKSIRSWESAALDLVENGYQRDKIAHAAVRAPDVLRIEPVLKDKIVRVEAALHPDEKALIFNLADSARRFVEFGCGGSTKIAMQSRAGIVESIDTDPAWLERMATDEDLRPWVDEARLKLHHLDIGATKEWGYPIEMDHAKAARYAKVPWSWFPLKDVDTVLVDGRFRVVTALEAALRTGDHCRILVDDYVPRPHFSVLEELLDIEHKATSMVLFGKGERWNRQKAFALLEDYRFDPR